MTTDLIKRMAGFAALCLAQALVFNRMHLFDCATPLLYVYLIIIFPHNYPRWGILLWSFTLGLAVDTFSNTPGVASASLTLTGAMQPYFFSLFIPREAPEDTAPSVETIGMAKFVFTLLCWCLFTVSHSLRSRLSTSLTGCIGWSVWGAARCLRYCLLSR